MSVLLPAPPATDPSDWPGLVVMAATVLLEAEGEPDEGKLAVACVIRTRMDTRQRSAASICLQARQFSCWNVETMERARTRLWAPDPAMWERCWRASAGAYWRMLPDPTRGASHYLNEALTRQGRPDGHLPSWFDEGQVTARIGQHTFLRLEG